MQESSKELEVSKAEGIIFFSIKIKIANYIDNFILEKISEFVKDDAFKNPTNIDPPPSPPKIILS